MTYISDRKNRLKQRLARVKKTLNNLYTTLDELSASGVESYSFDSGEGSQRTTRRGLKDIQDQIERLEAEEEHYINELNNMGLISIRLRRITP